MNRATITTEHDDPHTVAAAIAPDNTPEVETSVDGDAVVTTIERDSIGGLRATISDYLRAVSVADETTQLVTPENETQP